MSSNGTLTEIPNLWPEINVDAVSPVAILRAQASQLRQVTKGLVIADVNVATAKDKTSITFDLVAPALDNVRYRLITVIHDKDFVYPAKVSTGLPASDVDELITQLSNANGAPSQTEFIEEVGAILKDSRTIGVIQSLIARINEEKATTENETDTV